MLTRQSCAFVRAKTIAGALADTSSRHWWIRRRYVDFPITDVLQMMGRAGRPQYDQHGVAVIMVADTKKSFYKKVQCLRARNL